MDQAKRYRLTEKYLKALYQKLDLPDYKYEKDVKGL